MTVTGRSQDELLMFSAFRFKCLNNLQMLSLHRLYMCKTMKKQTKQGLLEDCRFNFNEDMGTRGVSVVLGRAIDHMLQRVYIPTIHSKIQFHILSGPSITLQNG